MSLQKIRKVLSTVHIGLKPQRTIHNSSPAQANVLSQSTFASETPFGNPVLDIFDAPVRLGESSRPHSFSPPRPAKALTPRPRQLPMSLPPPIIFDGPARPYNFPLVVRNLGRSHRCTPSTSRPSELPHLPSEPLVELFDGPARITRYAPRPMAKQVKIGKYFVMAGIAGAACVATQFA